MGAFILDRAFEGLIFVILRQFLVLIVVKIGFQISQVFIYALHIVAQFSVRLRKSLKGLANFTQNIKDAEDQLMGVFVRVQLHSFRQTLKITDSVRQSAHD